MLFLIILQLFFVIINSEIYYSEIATYNPFLYQTGYCKLQGFNTNSRLSSSSVQMFLDGRITLGVGISSKIFDRNITNNYQGPLCNACLNLTMNDNPLLNFNLNESIYLNESYVKNNIIAIVMDRCEDKICLDNKNMVDLDVYTSNIERNPYNISWNLIECPINNDTIEFLICNSNTCNKNNMKQYISNTTFEETITDYNFITIMPRNVKYPIDTISYNGTYLEYLVGLGFRFNFNIGKNMI